MSATQHRPLVVVNLCHVWMVVLVMDFQTVDIFVHALMVTAEWTAKTVISKKNSEI